MEPHWKVGDLAKLTGLTVRTLRYYDQIGLFSPSGYSDSGHRLYNEGDIRRLLQILSLKDLGLSLEEIQSMILGNSYSPSDIVAIQIDRVRLNIKNQRKLLAELEHVAERMNHQEPPTVDEFISLLEIMRMNHEKYIIEQRLKWENHLDQLGDYLSNNLT